MGISHYIKEIGRGKDGARPLARAQAADLFGQVLDGNVTDLEVGAFCLAMRIKGETPEEMAGFLDATQARLQPVPVADGDTAVVVLPSYNGARRLPVLTPLLALLLAREGLAVLVHGSATENTRVTSSNVFIAQGIPGQAAIEPIAKGTVAHYQTELLLPGLKRLLDVRRVVGLRNPAHSVVKQMNPVQAPARAVLVASYTHPEYALSMAATFELIGATALLLRGTEGEVVADPRRMVQMDGFVHGVRRQVQAAEPGHLPTLADLPASTDAAATANYIGEVLAGRLPVPVSIARQVEHILQLAAQSHIPKATP